MGSWEDISQYLENFSSNDVEQLQDPVRIISHAKGKCSGSPRDVQLTATCWALATTYWPLLGVVQHHQEEKRSKSTGTMSSQTMAEPERKGNKSTSIMSTQTMEETEGQPKPIAVAPVQKRKSKTKSVCIVNEEEEAGPSHPVEETEPEIIAHSLSVGELRELWREFTQQVEERDNQFCWIVWIQWPGTSEPQEYEALVDTSRDCTMMSLRYVGTESISPSGMAEGSQYQTAFEAEVSLTVNKWQKHPIMTGPEACASLAQITSGEGISRTQKSITGLLG
ncbi:hypothetical protein WISP_113560 [Willisornis vidua]|uniref:Uncharacterized protein n=1 Tax=Willisornis vidua TaxID=1566151 RepID=A0ABQ9CUV4_9PASS|nr:hypothetical protein WISP_113560 [Willisornis vidua]